MDKKPVVYTKGTLAECMKQWFEKFGSDDGLALMCKFIGISPITVARWAKGTVPGGLKAIKASVFLSLFMWEATDVKAKDPVIATLHKAIAFGLISEQDIAKELHTITDSVCDILRERCGTSNKRYSALRRIATRLNAAISEKENEWLSGEILDLVEGNFIPNRETAAGTQSEAVASKVPDDAVMDNTQIATFNTILSMTNSLSDIAQMHIDSAQLSDGQKLNFALAMSHLCKLLGIRSEALTQLLRDRQEKTTADLGEFQSLLKIGGR